MVIYCMFLEVQKNFFFYFKFLHEKGTDDNGKMNDLRKLNLTTFEWKNIEKKGNPPSKRSGHSACIVNNNMIIFGG